jgi:purine-cytosine permease-like protein
VLLALAAYILTDYLMLKRNSRRMTASGWIRIAVLSGILVSGGLLVIRNLTGTNFTPGFIIFLDITHLGLVMVFLLISLYCRIFKKHWTTER